MGKKKNDYELAYDLVPKGKNVVIAGYTLTGMVLAGEQNFSVGRVFITSLPEDREGFVKLLEKELGTRELHAETAQLLICACIDGLLTPVPFLSLWVFCDGQGRITSLQTPALAINNFVEPGFHGAGSRPDARSLTWEKTGPALGRADKRRRKTDAPSA